MRCLESSVAKPLYKIILKHAIAHKREGKQYWETILGMGGLLNNRLAIIPKRNMVVALGLTDNSTHAVANIKLLPKFARKMFFMEAYDVSFPLKHPRYIIKDNVYYNTILENSGIGKPFKALIYKLDYILRCIRYGEVKRLFRSLKRRFRSNA